MKWHFPLVWRKRLVESERIRIDLEGSNHALREMLKEAQKNDQRDSKTGRFMKGK